MERILNDNERIKRAEEIYYRRNNKKAFISNSQEYSKPKTYLGSKIMLEMLILLISATIVFAVKNKDYIFTKEFLSSCAQYNVNLTEKFAGLKKYFIDDIDSDEVFINKTEEQVPVNGEEHQQIIETQAEPAQTQTSQTIDSISFIKPIDGIITSRFGARESNYKNVTSNHTGIDISAEKGTTIKSAISGTVIQVSNEGDYGNHLKICKDNIITLYAHCDSIFVTEGQEIMQGQEIASVGSTGNSTGPHLHFEIRLDDIPIDPSEIIDFSGVV